MVATGATKIVDLDFQTNRTPYLLQHSALNWLKKHNLLGILIENPKYEDNTMNESVSKDNEFEVNFKSSWLDNLNYEQRIAVEQIIQGKNKSTPFMFFGPPGKLATF